MTPIDSRARRCARLVLFLAFGLWGQAQALKEDAAQPILIEADEVEIREAEDTSIYVGHVEVQQGSMRLLADHVTVYHRPDRRPRLIIALGQPVSYKQALDDNGEVQAFAKRMEYDADKDELALIGDGVLIHGEDRLTGEHILYERAKGRFRAGGSGRVRIQLTPDER